MPFTFLEIEVYRKIENRTYGHLYIRVQRCRQNFEKYSAVSFRDMLKIFKNSSEKSFLSAFGFRSFLNQKKYLYKKGHFYL